MNPHVVLVQSPLIDFDTLLTVAQQALGYSVSQAVDASPVKRTDAERFLSCLAAMQDRHSKPGLAPNLLSHVSFSVIVAADEEDVLAIAEIAEMPFVSMETLARGVMLLVLSGTLGQWREAVKRGSARDRSPAVRSAFNRLMALFTTDGLNVWKECASTSMPDGTLLLEDHR